MKKYLEALPIILTPVVFVLAFIALNAESIVTKISAVIGMLGFMVWYLISVSALNKNVLKGNFTVQDIVNVNLAVRLIYVPLYAIIFVLGCTSILMGPFGIGVIIALYLIDSIMLFLTSLSLISCNIALAKNSIFNKATCILFGIGNFVFCLDVILAIAYKVKVSKA